VTYFYETYNDFVLFKAVFLSFCLRIRGFHFNALNTSHVVLTMNCEIVEI
jgi:hypothetical protein